MEHQLSLVNDNTCMCVCIYYVVFHKESVQTKDQTNKVIGFQENILELRILSHVNMQKICRAIDQCFSKKHFKTYPKCSKFCFSFAISDGIYNMLMLCMQNDS